jgi:hypothetical protein
MMTKIVEIEGNKYFAKQWGNGPLNICDIGVSPIRLRGEFRWIPLPTHERVRLTKLANKKGAKVKIVSPRFYFEKLLEY